MKVKVTKSEKLERVIEVEVPKEKVVTTFNQVYEEIKKVAKVPGFRPGTAPRHILEKHHSRTAHEEVLKHLLSDTYHEALKTENIDAISLPEVTDVKLTTDSLSYTAKLEVRPDIQIDNYKQIKVKADSVEVNDKEIDEALENIKKSKKSEAIDEGFVHSLGYANLEELKEALKREMVSQKERNKRVKLENQVIDYLLKHAKFICPQTLIDKRYHELEEEMKRYLAQSRLPQAEAEAKEKEFQPKMREQAEEQVKVFLILEEIAKKENIKDEENIAVKVMEFLLKEAKWE